MNFYSGLICEKCNKSFPESELDLSHDVPRYMGGEDKDGRHYLCEDCNEEYDGQVLMLGLQYWIKQLPELDKIIFKNAAFKVKSWFFKKKGVSL